MGLKEEIVAAFSAQQDKLWVIIKARRRKRRGRFSARKWLYLRDLEDSTIAPNMQTDWLLSKVSTWTPCGRRLQPPGGIKQDWKIMATDKQGMPTPGQQDVAPALKARFNEWVDQRSAQGIETYGTPLQTFNGRNAGVDMMEETTWTSASTSSKGSWSWRRGSKVYDNHTI